MNKNKIIDFFSQPFPLLDEFRSKLFLVLFCGIFSGFFIYFYNPFNIKQINYESAIGNLLSIWNAGILGAIILSITQFFFRPKANLKTFNVGQFFLWVIFEFLCLSIGIFVIFGENKDPFLQEFTLILNYTISLAIIPYIFACLLIAVMKQYKKIKSIENGSTLSSEQHFFKDENGKTILAIKPKQILFLKSEGNYTSVFYSQNEKVERKMIRTNLKKLEGELEYSDLIRIHRSYMVNLQNIVSVHRKKGGFQIQLDQLPDFQIKVSETYKDSFESKIKQ